MGWNVSGRCGSCDDDDVVVEVRGCVSGKGREDEKMMCRICHLRSENRENNEVSELIQLGCGCKEELGLAHRGCAEAWFRIKGNRQCEICGALAENLTGTEEGTFMEQWREGRIPTTEAGRCQEGRLLFKLLIAVLATSLALSWFVRAASSDNVD